ncbi:hypothetical protein C8F01DRAFT_1181531 [Mycena amicta]|nr:hypothetical protein C8F01DRAFT_1181531 [Mycena amicta]
MHWNGFSACITIEGRVVDEFATSVSADKKTISCWIPSEVGKSFIVHWKNDHYRNFNTSGYITMDGRDCGGAVLSSQTLPSSTARTGISDGVTLRPFKFGNLELTDDVASLSQPVNPNLGTIKLQIAPIAHYAPVAYQPVESLPQVKLHERTKVQGAHQVELGEAQKLPVYNPRVVVWPAGPEIVNFLFLYRSLDVLRANGTARAPHPNLSPVPHVHSPLPQISHPAFRLIGPAPQLQPYHSVAPALVSRPGPAPSQRKRKAPEPLPAPTPNEDVDEEDLAAIAKINVLRDQLNRMEAKLASKKSNKKQKTHDEENQAAQPHIVTPVATTTDVKPNVASA